MSWVIKYTDKAIDTLLSLDKTISRRIKAYLDNRIATDLNPRRFGHALVGNLADYWRYRVGDYRIICEIKDKEVIVLVVRIGHRREIYKK